MKTQKGVLFNDICFKTNNGYSCQIDHVFISTKGIFVIETKNFTGSINASENWKDWVHFVGHNKYYIYSPFEQNRSHVRHLTNVLGSQHFENFVVFTNNRFRVNTESTRILKLKKFKKVFKRKLKEPDKYTKKDVQTLSKKLKDFLKENSVSSKEHVSYVKSIKKKAY